MHRIGFLRAVKTKKKHFLRFQFKHTHTHTHEVVPLFLEHINSDTHSFTGSLNACEHFVVFSGTALLRDLLQMMASRCARPETLFLSWISSGKQLLVPKRAGILYFSPWWFPSFELAACFKFQNVNMPENPIQLVANAREKGADYKRER